MVVVMMVVVVVMMVLVMKNPILVTVWVVLVCLVALKAKGRPINSTEKERWGILTDIATRHGSGFCQLKSNMSVG
jgi:hypothetical protein